MDAARTTLKWMIALTLALGIALPAGAAELSASLMTAYNSITSDEARQHVDTLANDTFEGREAGSRGGHAAGKYLVEYFSRAKLQPAGDPKSYFQAFGAQYRNILGVLPGSDPELRSEVVVIGAHYDHVGYGNQKNSFGPWGFVHNGADDNASGTSGLLEIVDAFSKLPQAPRRTILFALWDAEEKGLLGSEHWVKQPTLPLDRVHMTLNMDMIGRLRDNRIEVYGTRTARGLREFVTRQNVDSGLWLTYTWEMKANADHYTFYTRGLPTVFLHTGLHGDYHRPSDDAEKIDTSGIEKVARLAFLLTYAFADDAARWPFRKESRQDTPTTQKAFETSTVPPVRRLGVDWSPAADGNFVEVTRVGRASPAQKADVRVGDRIVQINGRKLDSPADFAELILIADRSTSLLVERGGEAQPIEKSIELDGGPSRWGIAWREDDAEPNSVTVIRVLSGSPGDKGGVHVGDRIMRVGDHDIRLGDNLVDHLAAAPATLELVVERDGNLMRLPLKSLK